MITDEYKLLVLMKMMRERIMIDDKKQRISMNIFQQINNFKKNGKYQKI
jgi:hypothetical protein